MRAGTLGRALCIFLSIIAVKSRRSSRHFYPLELQLLQAIQESDYIPVLLLPISDDYLKTSPWLSDLPFPVQVWSSLDMLLSKPAVKRKSVNRKMLVIVPVLYRPFMLSVFKRMQKMKFFLSFTRLLFILDSGEQLPVEIHREARCSTILLNASSIAFPVQNGIRCTYQVSKSATGVFSSRSV